MNKEYKCHFCKTCDGRGCINELPGMGGVFNNKNFIANCTDWKKYHKNNSEKDNSLKNNPNRDYPPKKIPKIRLAPMTGAVQNIGYTEEEPFYLELINFAIKENILLSIGDGYPDEKLKFGIEALKTVNKKGGVFLKPYPQDKLFERIDRSKPVAEFIGVDIDSYNIVTMRNLVSLERKTAKDLKVLREYAKLPIAVKGVFTQADIEMVKELKPDITIISNHGGRIETELGSTADFAAKYASTIAKYSGEVWIDGGLRNRDDILAAGLLGASEVLIGRPCITALLSGREFFPKRI